MERQRVRDDGTSGEEKKKKQIFTDVFVAMREERSRALFRSPLERGGCRKPKAAHARAKGRPRARREDEKERRIRKMARARAWSSPAA